jgi:hypothetical protein
MTADAIAWAAGIGIPVLTGAVLFLANWVRGVSAKQADTARAVESLRAHVAENYVRGHEVAEVKRAVETLRQELTHKVDELLKAVHELIGQAQTKK